MTGMLRLILGVFLLAASLCHPARADASDAAASWEHFLTAYAAAQSQGDMGSIDRAAALVDAHLARYKGDARALTYKGSLSCMRARESLWPWRKLSLLRDGIGWMDDGVAAVLADKAQAASRLAIDVRMVRGITSARIPATFGRGGVARADFRAIVAHPQFASISAPHRATALAWLAVLAQRDGDEAAASQQFALARQADAAVAAQVWESTR